MVADFNKKANREFFNDKLLFKTVGIIFLAVIIVLVFADFKIYQKKQELTLEVNAYKKQIEDIQKSSQNLKEEIANTDNTDYLEKLGYEQFGEARPGETEYMFIKSQGQVKPVVKPENSWDIKSWWNNLVNGFNWIKSKL
jgi:cell division protein FtsB